MLAKFSVKNFKNSLLLIQNMFIMSKLKIFLLPFFISVLLLPCMVVGQEVESQN